jgi:hypothetical protein
MIVGDRDVCAVVNVVDAARRAVYRMYLVAIVSDTYTMRPAEFQRRICLLLGLRMNESRQGNNPKYHRLLDHMSPKSLPHALVRARELRRMLRPRILTMSQTDGKPPDRSSRMSK